MLKLTEVVKFDDPSEDRPIWVAPEAVFVVGVGLNGAMLMTRGYSFQVRESAEEVVRMVDEAMAARQSTPAVYQHPTWGQWSSWSRDNERAAQDAEIYRKGTGQVLVDHRPHAHMSSIGEQP
jgi:hypothetical protein